MSQRQWTAEQRQAVAARGVSVALSAGAGCGKTFVLTERFLSELGPAGSEAAGQRDLSDLVAITFTERAAREMRQRIRDACRRQVADAPEEQASYWLDLVRQLDTARISTIHSFCDSLLRANAVEAGLDPQLGILDQAQAQTLIYESLEERLRNRLARRDEALVELVAEYGLERLYEMIGALLARRREIDWKQWQGETAGGLAARWAEYWRTVTLPDIPRRVADSLAAQEVLDIARSNPCSHPEMIRRLAELARRLPALRETGDPAADLESIRQTAQVKAAGSKRDWDSEGLYDRFRHAADSLRKLIDKMKGFLDFDADAARPAAEMALRLLDVAAEVNREYDQRKREASVLDFDDLLIHARALLVGPQRQSLRERLGRQIKLLLVDEFQDTDPLQVELVKALCDDELTRGKLFFVGDLKQSIYRFRGADPRVFRELRREIPAEGRLPLTLNFRSQPAVLDFINALFCEELKADEGSDGRYEALRPHRPQVGGRPAVEFLWAAEEQSGPRAGQQERRRRREADWIARRLRAMLDSGEPIVWDSAAAAAGRPAARAVRPGDVALLFRALSSVELYEDALQQYGIDYYLVGGHAFYAQQEVFDLLNLLRAVDNPCDEVSLAGVLRSPFFSLLDETLFWLAQHSEGLNGGLFAQDLPAELDPQQRRRVEHAAAVLGQLRAIKDRVPTAELIGRALAQTGYDAILLAEFLGQRKLANLRKLTEQARSYDRSGIFTLADLITQLAHFVAQQPDEPLAATHPESSDVVRLMTIHQAKGLEFPVVVVPDVARSRRGPSDSVAFTPQLGPMVRDPAKDQPAKTGLDLHVLAEEDEDRAELTRLLYVATTRAADYLILSAGVPELGVARGPWMELIARRFDLQDGSLKSAGSDSSRSSASGDASYGGERSASGDAFCAGDVLVKVTTAEPPLDSRPSSARGRPGLRRIIEKARQMAQSGAGRVPRYLGPIPPDPAARRQFSFSRLSGAIHAPSSAPGDCPDFRPGDCPDFRPGDCPDFREAKMGLSPSRPGNALPPPGDGSPLIDPLGLGTLVHAVLAELDFRQPGDVEAVVRRHAWRHLPEADQGLEEPIELVRRFVASARAAQIAAAEEVYPELEFLLPWPPGDGPADDNEPPGRYLQGFIDCLYRDAAGGWHLVDYKTNRATPETLAAVAAGYEMQMLLYGLAVEQILGCPPVELVLCLLRPGLEYHFPWNNTSRQRVLEMVDRALA